MNARPMWLSRRADFKPTRLEYEDDTPADPTRTFGPRKVCGVCASAWAFVVVTAICTACAIVHVVAMVIA